MHKLMMLLCALAYLPQAKTQHITGLWQGSLFNDSTDGNYFYEIKIDSTKNGYSAITRTQFILNEESYSSTKSATVKNINGKWIIIDDKTLSTNVPQPLPKGIKQLNVLVLNADSLTGPFATNTTKTYSEVTGFIRLQKNGGAQLTDLSVALTQQRIPNAVLPVLTSQKPPTKSVGQRTNIVQATVQFTSDTLQLFLYDNGEIDGDTVSVFLNDKPVITNAGLGITARKATIILPPGKDSAMLIMFAETLGTLPPNTGLLIIMDGTKRNELRFAGDTNTNAAILLKRKKYSNDKQ